jgi:hypothetical protein
LPRGEGTNRLRCRSVSFAHGKELHSTKNLGAVSKQALEYFVVVYLAVNFQQINRSGGSRSFVAGRIELHLYARSKVSARYCNECLAGVLCNRN